MSILSITTNQTGQIAQLPRKLKIVSTDNLATVTAAGYLNSSNLMGYTIAPSDVIDFIYSWNTATQSGTYEVMLPTFSSGVITLGLWANAGDVLLPVVSGDFATFNGTTGQIYDAGYLPSNAAKTVVAMVGSAVVSGYIAHFVDTSGTIDDTAGPVTQPGNIYAGLSGTAGLFRSYPATVTTGYLGLTGVANAGDYAIQIANVSHGQATIHSLPDPGNAASRILVAATATPFTSGNLIKSSGTGGLVVDAGFAVLAKTTAAYAGGGTSNAFTATGLASTSIVTATILTSTNSVSITKAVPTASTLTVTFSADPGAATTVSYIAITPAV